MICYGVGLRLGQLERHWVPGTRVDSLLIIKATEDGTSFRDMPGNWQVVPAQAGQSRTPCATRPDRWVLGWGRLRAREGFTEW